MDMMNVKVTYDIRDFERYAVDGDYTPAVIEALRECRRHPCSELKFSPGTYHFRKQFSFEKEYYISNNTYSLKSIIFPVIGIKDLTIDGCGSEFIMHGEVLPFVIDHSEGISLKNFSIDYPRPFFSQGEIIASDNKSADIQFDIESFPLKVENESISFYSNEDSWRIGPVRQMLAAEINAETRALSAYHSPYIAHFEEIDRNHFLSKMAKRLRAEQLTPDIIRLHGALGHTAGNYWVMTHARRENPGIFICYSNDINLECINIYHAAAMGVIGHVSENITLSSIYIAPRPGTDRLVSVNADATHFVNCSGNINLYNCTFTHMMDDCGNYHGIYTTVARIMGDNLLLLEYRHVEQKGVELYMPGDSVHLVENDTLKAYATLTVASAELLSGQYIRVETKEKLPDILRVGHAVENFTRMPAVHIKGCTVGYNRPRGFLISTNRKVVIEDNTFHNSSCSICIAGDARDWFESGPVHDVTIRNNNFQNCAYSGGSVIVSMPAIKERENNYYHSGIRIENNIFEMHEKRFLNMFNCCDVTFRNNKYIHNPELPAHPVNQEIGINMQYCKDCCVEPAITE